MKKILLTGFALLATASAWATDYNHCIPRVTGMGVVIAPSVSTEGKLFVPSFISGPQVDSIHRSADKEVAVMNSSNTLPDGRISKAKTVNTLIKADGKPQVLESEYKVNFTEKDGKPLKTDDPFWTNTDMTNKTFYKYDQKDLCYVDRTSVVVKGKETVNYDHATCDKILAAVRGKEQFLNQCTSALQNVKKALDAAKGKFAKEGVDFKIGFMGSPAEIREYKKGELNDIAVASMAYTNCNTINNLYNPKWNVENMPYSPGSVEMPSGWPETDDGYVPAYGSKIK